MFTYTAFISKNLASAELIPSYLTYRRDGKLTYNYILDRATNKLKTSQLASFNHRLSKTPKIP